MLTVIAQPKSSVRLAANGGFGAAGSLVTVIAIALVLLAPPASSPAATAAGGSGAWPWPLLGEVITPYKNGSDRYAAGQHRGVDIAAPAGTPVLAVTPGRVSYSGRLPDGGNAVTLRSEDGAWLVSSLHLAERDVRIGQRVRAGTRLGSVGSTGRRSVDQPHVHLSVRRADSRAYVDPMTLLGAQRVATTARSAAPKIEALERPAARSADVRAHTTGDSAPAPRHGVQGRRTAAAHSAGENAHEGDAADGISRVAPPPISHPAEVAADSESVRTSQAGAPKGTPLNAEREPREQLPRRLLLVAIAVLCLAALIVRRQPRRTPPAENDGRSAVEQADVIPLRRTG